MNRIENIKNHLISSQDKNSNNNYMNTKEEPKIKVVSYKNGCKKIILNRNESLNSLNMEMLKMLDKYLTLFSNDNSCKFIIITTNNYKTDKAFCAGGDIKEFSEYSRSSTGVTPFIKLEYRLDHTIHTFNKPIISFVNGIVMGGGVGLSIHCSHRVIGDNVQWAMPECKIGYFPDVGTNYFLSRLGSIGMYLALTGYKMNSNDMIYSKLATHYIPADIYDRVMDELCQDDDDNEIITSRQIDFILNKYRKTLYPNKENSNLFKFKELIDKCFSNNPPNSNNSIINIFSNLNEIINNNDSLSNSRIYNNEEIKWAIKTKDLMSPIMSSPTSICVTFEVLKRALSISDIEDIFIMEIRVGTRLGNRNDIVEGVHKSLINRKAIPKWSPSTINEITQDFINSFFLPFDDPNLEFDLNYIPK